MRTLTNIEIAALNETLSELGPALFGDGSYDIKVEQSNNKLVVTISEKDYKAQFEDYLKTLDDEIFTAACEYYTHVTGEDLSKIKTITPDIITKFKGVVRKVVNKKIMDLKNKYGC